MFNRRKNEPSKTKKHGKFFYGFAVGIFALITLLCIIAGFVSGFTQERLALICLNGWFCLFTMNHITTRFKRSGETAPWHEWTAFSKNIELPSTKTDDTPSYRA